MQEERPSATATGVALLRALHQKVDGEPRILHDPISERLLDPRGMSWAMSHPDRFQTPQSRGLRTHVVVRSRFAEDKMAEAVARGTRQIVVLGAGLDTFAYRQPEWAQDTRIFEVDHPASQADKKRRLAVAGIEIPENVIMGPVDFENESLGDGLSRAGLDVARPAFFSCLGVLMYLTEAAMVDLFAFLGAFPARSELVLTFSSDAERSEGHREMEAKVASVGEPMRNFVSEAGLTSSLQHAGFGDVHIVQPAEVASRYLGGRTDGLKAPRRATLAHARR